MLIKVLLIASILAASWWLLHGHQRGSRLAVTRLASLGFTASWIIAVIAPDLVTRAANLAGVGRGTDLVLYILVVAFTFSAIATHLRTRELEDRIATLTRSQALLEADVQLRYQPDHHG